MKFVVDYVLVYFRIKALILKNSYCSPVFTYKFCKEINRPSFRPVWQDPDPRTRILLNPLGLKYLPVLPLKLGNEIDYLLSFFILGI